MRFRGTHVEIFTHFQERFKGFFSKNNYVLTEYFLDKNYRSSKNIVEFCNSYLQVFPFYKPLRFQMKPNLIASSNLNLNAPIVRISNSNEFALARTISDFIDQLFKGSLTIAGINYPVGENFKASDITFLSRSTREQKYFTYYRGFRMKFAGKLRTELEKRGYNIFNPRGEDLTKLKSFNDFLITLVLILDPQLRIIKSTSDDPDFDRIKMLRRAFLANVITNNKDLANYMGKWIDQITEEGTNWEDFQISLVTIVYDLIVFFPDLLKVNMNIIYISTLVKQIEEMQLVDPTGTTVIYNENNPDNWNESIANILNFILIPALLGDIAIDESIIEYVPSDHISFNTFHQVKGLEFSVIFVDVGTEISHNDIHEINQRMDTFYYPVDSSTDTVVNHFFSDFSQFTPELGKIEEDSFSQIIRKYFVAFSRAKFLLILIGTDAAFANIDATLRNDTTNFLNVALGDTIKFQQARGNPPNNTMIAERRKTYDLLFGNGKLERWFQ